MRECYCASSSRKRVDVEAAEGNAQLCRGEHKALATAPGEQPERLEAHAKAQDSVREAGDRAGGACEMEKTKGNFTRRC